MTNEERIRENISTTEKLAEYLVIYNDYYGEYYTSDYSIFEPNEREKAIKHEIEWLRSESDV